eukprot:jgi/Galph1/2387/GphlegSOOS_G1066.1
MVWGTSHCQALAPEMERLGESVKNSSHVIVAQIDADKDQELSKRFGIEGYPTIKWMNKGNTSDWQEYQGERTAEALISFINNQTKQQMKLVPIESFVVELGDNFESIVMDPNSHVLVEFYAPWCGHCKTLRPQYEKVAKTYRNVKGLVIAAIDADKYKTIAETYRVVGFPTIKLFPAGKDKKPIEYDASRMAVAMIDFINRQVGLDLDVGGEPLPDAGRVEVMDNFARDFMNANSSKYESIRKATEDEIKAQGLKGQLLQNARFYLNVMERYQKEGDAYLRKELNKTQKALKNEQLSATKRSNLLRKKNILEFFANVKESERMKAEAVGDSLEDDDAN